MQPLAGRSKFTDLLCDLFSVASEEVDGQHRPSRHPVPVGSSITFVFGASFFPLPCHWALAALKHRRVSGSLW